MSSQLLSTIRTTVLGLTGLVCFFYAIAAIYTQTPDPIWPWIPMAFGLASALIITLAAFAAGPKAAQMATDEGYFDDSHKAQRTAFWVALLLYPAFAIPLSRGWVDWHVAYAAMSTLTGGTFLLLFVWFDLRGR
jgi:cobalamin synthase